jgi:transposase
MKPLSMDLRERIVNAVEKGDSSIRKIAQRFAVSKNTVERLIKHKRTQGHLAPRKQGGTMVSPVMQYKDQLLAIFERHSDASLAQYCELLFDETGLWVSQSTMCRTFQRLNLPRKKRRFAPARPSANASNF